MSSADFDKDLAALVDAWCERRELDLLRLILCSYPRVSVLTDEWASLATALKTIRVQHSASLKEPEFESVVNLLHIAEGVVYR